MSWTDYLDKVLDGYVEIEKEKAKNTAPSNPVVIPQPDKGATNFGEATVDDSNLKTQPDYKRIAFYGVAGFAVLTLSIVLVQSVSSRGK